MPSKLPEHNNVPFTCGTLATREVMWNCGSPQMDWTKPLIFYFVEKGGGTQGTVFMCCREKGNSGTQYRTNTVPWVPPLLPKTTCEYYTLGYTCREKGWNFGHSIPTSNNVKRSGAQSTLIMCYCTPTFKDLRFMGINATVATTEYQNSATQATHK